MRFKPSLEQILNFTLEPHKEAMSTTIDWNDPYTCSKFNREFDNMHVYDERAISAHKLKESKKKEEEEGEEDDELEFEDYEPVDREDHLTLDYMLSKMAQVIVYIDKGKQCIITKQSINRYEMVNYKDFLQVNWSTNHVFLYTGKSKPKLTTFKEIFIMNKQRITTRIQFNTIPYVTGYNEKGIKEIYADDNLDEDTYNLFSGYKSSVLYECRYNPKKFRLMKKHIFEVYCNRDKAKFIYFKDLLSWIVKNPAMKPEKAIVLIGSQGCGKSKVIKAWASSVFGPGYYNEQTDIEKMTGNFNKEIEGKKVIIGNEVKGFGKNSEKLKALISEKELRIESKGIDAYTVNDYAFYVFCSNNKDFFKIEDDDRRYFVLDCNNEYACNSSYFGPLFKELEDPEFGDHFYTYLIAREISPDFSITEPPLMTDIKQEMVMMSMDPFSVFTSRASKDINFLLEMITPVNLTFNRDIHDTSKNRICYDYKGRIKDRSFIGIQVEHLHLIYKHWLQENYPSYKTVITLTTFGSKLDDKLGEKEKHGCKFFFFKKWNEIDLRGQLKAYSKLKKEEITRIEEARITKFRSYK